MINVNGPDPEVIKEFSPKTINIVPRTITSASFVYLRVTKFWYSKSKESINST